MGAPAIARHQKVPRHDHPRRRVISDIEFVKDKAKDTPKIVAVADASAPPSAAALRGLLLGPLRFRRRPPGRPPCLPKTLLTLTQPRVASLSATVCVASVAYGADTRRSAAFFTLHSLLCRRLHCFEAGKPHIESEANGFDLVVDGTIQGFPFAFQSCEKASPARS